MLAVSTMLFQLLLNPLAYMSILGSTFQVKKERTIPYNQRPPHTITVPSRTPPDTTRLEDELHTVSSLAFQTTANMVSTGETALIHETTKRGEVTPENAPTEGPHDFQVSNSVLCLCLF